MKKKLRARLLEERNSLTSEEVTRKSAEVCKNIEDIIFNDNCKTVLVYIPNDNETDIFPIIKRLLKDGKTVAAPICVEKGVMVPSLVEDLEKDLAPGRYGILAPKEQRLVPYEDIDVVIVPGVGFDINGNRLGFGAGYYDRFLPKMRPDSKKIAICYDFQIVDFLKVEPWDFPADVVVTESKIYTCKKA